MCPNMGKYFQKVNLLFNQENKRCAKILYWKRKGNKLNNANLIFMQGVNLTHLDQCQTNRRNWPFPLYSIFVGLGETWGSTG